jgi:hypothetical protein
MTDARGFGVGEVLAALDLPMKDLEDAMQASAARSYGASWLVTRNVGDYKKSPVPAVSPSEFLNQIASKK